MSDGMMVAVCVGDEIIGAMPRPDSVATWYEYPMDHGPTGLHGPWLYDIKEGNALRVRFRGRGGTVDYPQKLCDPEILEYGKRRKCGYHDIIYKPATIEHLQKVPGFMCSVEPRPMPKGTKVAVAEAALPIVVEGKSLTKRDIEWILRSARHFGTGASAEITKILCQIALGEREIEPGHTSLVAYQDEKVADTEKRF